MRNDTYTGGEHYWIRFHNGGYEVRKEEPEYKFDNSTVFKGTYKECLKFLALLTIQNFEYDNDI